MKWSAQIFASISFIYFMDMWYVYLSCVVASQIMKHLDMARFLLYCFPSSFSFVYVCVWHSQRPIICFLFPDRELINAKLLFSNRFNCFLLLLIARRLHKYSIWDFVSFLNSFFFVFSVSSISLLFFAILQLLYGIFALKNSQ